MLRLLASDIMTGGRKWADDFTTLDLSAAGTNPLVVRRSLSGDEDRDAEVPTIGLDRRRRARCVPIGRSTSETCGHSRTARYSGSPAYRQTDPPARNDLPSSGSLVHLRTAHQEPPRSPTGEAPGSQAHTSVLLRLVQGYRPFRPSRVTAHAEVSADPSDRSSTGLAPVMSPRLDGCRSEVARAIGHWPPRVGLVMHRGQACLGGAAPRLAPANLRGTRVI